MEGVDPAEPSGSDVLDLDIGGEKTVKTLRSTLTFVTGSKLGEMFSGRWSLGQVSSQEQGWQLVH